jgi:hypothetical protein
MDFYFVRIVEKSKVNISKIYQTTYTYNPFAFPALVMSQKVCLAKAFIEWSKNDSDQFHMQFRGAAFSTFQHPPHKNTSKYFLRRRGC